MIKFKFIVNVLSFFLIISVITSCAVNDKEAFNIIDEAKKILLDITNDKKNAKVLKQKETKSKTEKIKKEQVEEKTKNKDPKHTVVKKDTNKKKKETVQNEEIKESKLISRRKEKIIQKEDKGKKNPAQNDLNLVENVLKIGVLLPLTGEHKELGNLILNALEMALFQSDNKKLKLIIRDTKADPKTTKKVFEEFLDNNIKIFIGPLYSKSLASIESFVSEKKIKVFALTNNSNLAKKGIWTFGVDPQQQTRKILNFIIARGDKKIGALLPDNAYGYLLYDTIEKILNENNLSPFRVEFFKDDIESQRLAANKISRGFERYEEDLRKREEAIESKEPEDYLINNENLKKPLDSIFIGASGQNLTILASQLQYSSVDPKKVSYVGIASWEDGSILQEPALRGGMFATTSELLQKDVKKTFFMVYGSDMPKVSMVAYDILSLLNVVLYENGEIQIKHLLNESGYLGLRGLFRLRNNGTVERTFQIKRIIKEKFQTYQEAPKFFEN